MASRKELLTNLREYTSEEVAQAIQAGVVTMYELSKSGNLTPMMRRRIEAKLEASSSAKNTPSTTSNTEAEEVVATETPVIADTSVAEVSQPYTSAAQVEEEAAIPLAAKEEEEEIYISEATPDSDEDDYSTPPSPTASTEEADVTNEEPTSQTTYTSTFTNKGMFRRPFSFKGRIRRTEFCLSYLIYLVWIVLAESVLFVSRGSTASVILCLVTVFPMTWFIIAQSCKRCHDRNNSGWCQLIPYYYLILLFGNSAREPYNKYGDRPKN